MQVSVLFLYCKYSGLFEGVCGRSDNESGKPYMQTGSQLLHSIFLVTLEENSCTYQQRRALN